jgi:hypothetical protein
MKFSLNSINGMFTFLKHCSICRPPILQATAVWLTYGRGFENAQVDGRDELESDSGSNLGFAPANSSAPKSPEEINMDKFHLV